MTAILYQGDCVEQMRGIPDASIDAVVCDPPYGLEFMGHDWDGADGFRRSLNSADVSRDNAFGRVSRTSPEYRAGKVFEQWCELWAIEVLRVLKPGGHLLAFGGTRTSHRLAVGVEDAGFEIRDEIMWLHGQGFPKSLDVSKAIDKRRDEAVSADSRQWQGWGTALKPAHEPIVVARKPPIGTVAANVLEHGTGALNVDGCRIEGEPWQAHRATGLGSVKFFTEGATPEIDKAPHDAGRWPANVVLDEQAAAELDAQAGELTSGAESERGHRRNADREAGRNAYGGFQGQDATGVLYGDSGGASRFFYCAKTSRAERNAGLEGFEAVDDKIERYRLVKANPSRKDGGANETRSSANHHPTVKPINLMRWLVRLVTPPGGTVLDPFAGSGSTGCAPVLEGFDFVGIERETEYVAIAEARIGFWASHRGREVEDVLKGKADARPAYAGQLDLGEAA